MKKKNDYELCTLHGVEFKNSSFYGDPSYWIYFTDSDNNFHVAYTSANASAGYTAVNYRNAPDGSKISMKYHCTKNGNYIVDYIEHNTPEQVPENIKSEKVFFYKG